MTAAAVLAWLGLALQLAVLIGNMDTNGMSLPQIFWRLAGYFTVLTNLVVAVSYTSRLVAPAAALGRFFERTVVDSAVLAAITLVGAVYVLILQNLWQPQGLQLLADVLLHYVAPLGYIGSWIAFRPRGLLQWRFVPPWLIYPLCYLVYAMLRGALDGWYAYPFIDVAAIGYGRTLVNSIGLMIAFSIVGLLIVGLDKAAVRLRAPAARTTAG